MEVTHEIHNIARYKKCRFNNIQVTNGKLIMNNKISENEKFLEVNEFSNKRLKSRM